MTDIIAKHNAYFMGTGGKLLRIKIVNASSKFGLLYNWYAATDNRNIAANGWRMPTRQEWFDLILATGGTKTSESGNNVYYNGGTVLKKTGTTYWNSGGTDIYGFGAVGGGQRNDYNPSLFASIKDYGEYLCSNNSGTYTFYIEFSTSNQIISSSLSYKTGGSIRLVAESGNPTEYISNDRKSYSVVTVNGVTWLAENLKETKYRNGDTIPEVTDGATWAGLTTGALCAYNNDWNNV